MHRTSWFFERLARAAGGAVVLALLCSAPAHAAPHRDGHVYQYWDVERTHTVLVQQLEVKDSARATRWGSIVFLTPETGGLIALEQATPHPDSRRVRFSIGGATGALPGLTSTCTRFAGANGSGITCTSPYRFAINRPLRLRVELVAGTTWAATVIDVPTGERTVIAYLTAPAGHTRIFGTTSLAEYFGAELACSDVPRSQVVFAPPALGTARATGIGSYVAPCSGGLVTTPWGLASVWLGSSGGAGESVADDVEPLA